MIHRDERPNIMGDSVAATVDAVIAHGGELVQPIGSEK